jgi:hypothetical protein
LRAAGFAGLARVFGNEKIEDGAFAGGGVIWRRRAGAAEQSKNIEGKTEKRRKTQAKTGGGKLSACNGKELATAD